MNQNLDITGQPVSGQPASNYPLSGQPPAHPTFAPAPVPTTGQQARPTAAGQTPQTAAPAASPTTPASKAAGQPTQAGPGTGVPNPNYTYRKKPPLLGVGLQRDILSLLIKIAVIAGIVMALFTFIFGVTQYNSPAMYPAVKSGDLVLFSRFDKNYVAQDLIVVSYQGEIQVRRVVALSGNVVDIDVVNSRLMVDGAQQQEAHIYNDTHRYETEIDFPLTVPEGHVFVLGDYREGVTDSRTYGTIPIEDSQGKVISLFRRRGF